MIEQHIREALAGEAQKNALELAAFLRANNMQFDRGTGYWEDKRYWHIRYKDEFVCFILVNGYGSVSHKDEPEGWIIWSDISDSSDSQWYESAPLVGITKEIALQNIDFCANCSPGSPCYGGMRKIIFGKEFNKVCRTTFRFDNPSAEALECVKKLVELRKNDIVMSCNGTPKEDIIDFTKITACGECCVGCMKKEDGLCEGCIESDGHCKEWTQSKGYPIYKCAKKHKVQFCGLCDEFPCDWLTQKVTWNPNIVDDLTELERKYKKMNT